MTGRRPPCVPRSEVRFDEEQYFRGNRAGYRFRNPGKTDEEIREIANRGYQRLLDEGLIPPACAICGYHHR